MVGWMEMCDDAKKQLDRELQDQEIEFIKWICEKHHEEESVQLNVNS